MSTGFDRAKKTFLGFLQARGKAINTIKNYACDLSELGDFCRVKGFDFQQLGLSELEAYHEDLKTRGLRPNSRRRKLMTAKTFLRYMSGRMDVSTVGCDKIIPPDKVEKPPKLVARETVLHLIDSQPDHDIGCRNRALLGVLLDTGMLVTEALALQQQDCTELTDGTGALLTITGKRSRTARVSPLTAKNLNDLAQRLAGRKHFFYGYSRSGPNAERLTARGVEILFKGWSKGLGIKHFHPRTLRHLYVVDAMLSGKSEHEIMQALALRTPYAFRVYRPLVDEIKSNSETTCNVDTSPEQAPDHP
jgi:site-specific recombinase XerD